MNFSTEETETADIIAEALRGHDPYWKARCESAFKRTMLKRKQPEQNVRQSVALSQLGT